MIIEKAGQIRSLKLMDDTDPLKPCRSVSELFTMTRSRSSFSLGEKIGTVFIPLLVVFDYVISILASCIVPKESPPAKPAGYEDPAVLASKTIFSVHEVEALHELFKRLSNSVIRDGLLHKEEFLLALFRSSNTENFFADRIFDLFDVKRNGVIAFGEFVCSLSVFHPSTPVDEKIDFAFRVYDLRQTGFIEREQVKQMMIALLGESDLNLTEDLLNAILDKTFSEADFHRDGKIDKEEWRVFVMQDPSVLRNMTIPALKSSSWTCVTIRQEIFYLESLVESISC